MPRRVSLPQADDLFRPTVVRDAEPPSDPSSPALEPVAVLETTGSPASESAARVVTEPKPTGRVRHDEKMTVYVSSEELLDIEDARIALRRGHGVAADRGRLVRAAVALALADLDTRGGDSDLVSVLRQQ